MALSPDPQTWLILKAVFSLGILDFINACLAGFCPLKLGKTCPNITSSISWTSVLDLSKIPFITIEPNSWAWSFLWLPSNLPMDVLNADTKTISFEFYDITIE